MANQTFFTLFAPAERKSEEEVFQQTKLVSEQRLINKFLDSIQDILVVLNQERQIVYANQNLLNWLQLERAEEVCGLRFGEAVGCMHARELEGGCGTTEFCRTCGAARAILNSQGGQRESQECRIIRSDGAALDLKVKTSPITIEQEKFVVLAAVDIASEKRVNALEQIFLRDITSTATGLQNFSRQLRNVPIKDLDSLKENLHNLTEQLLEEIAAQRDLAAAENDELGVETETLNSLEVFFNLSQIMRVRPYAKDIQIIIDEQTHNVTFVSDPRLLTRVLGHMLRNAIEASQTGDPVYLGCEKNEGTIIFWVQNAVCMPREVQLQIFQRFFSTKGDGRGLGTYSIKLLTEKYLKGRVHFDSEDGKGTRFSIELPLFIT